MNMIEKIGKWRNYRTTKTQLEGLSNAQLDDLGILRRDIKTIAMNRTR